MLKISDPYVAYCMDEAGAWLVAQKDQPSYPGDKKTLNGNGALIAELKARGLINVKDDTRS